MNNSQERLLVMLDYFHNFCIENNLRYYVIGGTALGTARHQGFIPWDDDVDVGMPRVDYEKMKKLVNNKQFGNYYFEYYGKKKDYVYPYCKMYDISTTLIENTRYKTKRGIYIDIFPLDGVGDTKKEALINFRKIDRLINLFETKVCAIRKGRKLYKNMAILLMRLIPEFLISRNRLIKKIEKNSKKYNFDKANYIANFAGNWHEKEIFERRVLGKPSEYMFEDIKVMGPENIDDFLTGVYGDWRTPPPIEKQVTHHDYVFLDLNTSYKD